MMTEVSGAYREHSQSAGGPAHSETLREATSAGAAIMRKDTNDCAATARRGRRKRTVPTVPPRVDTLGGRP